MTVEELDEIGWNVMALFYDTEVSQVGKAIYHFKVEYSEDPEFVRRREESVRQLLGLGWVAEYRQGEVGPCADGQEVWEQYRVRVPLGGDPLPPPEMMNAVKQMMDNGQLPGGLRPPVEDLNRRLADLRERARRNQAPDPGDLPPPRPAQQRNAMPQRQWGEAPPRPAARGRDRKRTKYRFID